MEPPTLVDSHAHLDFDRFADDRQAVIRRAFEAGLRHIVVIGAGRGTEGAYDAVALAAGHRALWATVGVHPHDADLGIGRQADPRAPVDPAVRTRWEVAADGLLARQASLALHPKVVAIGEVGLDFHYDRSAREFQRALFRRSVRLAVELDLPLVIHARDAEDEAAAILGEEGAGRVGGVIHCFTGHPGLARAGLALGFSFGLTGVLTFPNARALRETAAGLPFERLLVETDCPYLAPVPHRGRRNEPAHVIEVVRALADLKGVDLATAAQQTCDNARRVYRLAEREREAAGQIAYRYGQGLYLNVTNRCTLGCRFCLKHAGYDALGVPLGLLEEPSADEVLRAARRELRAAKASEVVFCGLGEPLLRLDLVCQVGRALRAEGVRVRVDTDGLASLVHGLDAPRALAGAADAISISLNAHDRQTHAELCPSVHGPRAFDAVCEFIRGCAAQLPEVTASVVRQAEIDIDAARALALSLGAGQFRVRG
ncbi:MAG: TatD family hydrolase [Deltaproteobacteria bacterium]|nr:TatD family hydrolase [Deltaproteobacteria bacterium]